MLRSNGTSPDVVEKMMKYVWTLLLPSAGEAKLINTISDVTQSMLVEGMFTCCYRCVMRFIRMSRQCGRSSACHTAAASVWGHGGILIC